MLKKAKRLLESLGYWYFNLLGIDDLEGVIRKASKRELVDGIIPECVIKDRAYLVLLLAKSFHEAGKLILEKKLPSSKNIILVFQMRNGNVRFSLPENLVPESVMKSPIYLNNNKVDYNKNYKLIEELITK